MLTTERQRPRLPGQVVFWALSGVAVASLCANGVLAWKVAKAPEESTLPCRPPWDDHAGHDRIKRHGYREIAPPLAAVDVPGIEDLEHKPLLLLYEASGGPEGGWAPSMILYEDGLAVVQRRFETAEGGHVPMSLIGHVSAEAARRFVRDRIAGHFAQVPERVDLWWMSFDGPAVEVYLRDGSKWLHAKVDNLGPRCEGPNERCRAPEEVQIIYKWALRLDVPDASRWTGQELPSADYINKVQQAVNGASELARRARSKSDGGTP